MRYHNYIADNLARWHPKWSDEKLFQESRRILTAVFQITVYNEFLPPLLGREFMRAFKLTPGSDFDDYFNGKGPLYG